MRSNYVTKQKRLAIYKRDQFSCLFCGVGIKRDVSILSLDHLQARSKNGNHSSAKNLVCSCRECNNAKANKTLSQFAREIGLHPKQLKRRIKKQTNTPINIKAARKAINGMGYRLAVATF